MIINELPKLKSISEDDLNGVMIHFKVKRLSLFISLLL